MNWLVGALILGLVACGHVPTNPVASGQGSLENLSLESFLLRLANTRDEQAAKDFLQSACERRFEVACGALGQKVSIKRPLPILQGPTTESASLFITQNLAKEPVYLLVWADSFRHPINAVDTVPIPIPNSEWALTQFSLEGLHPGKTYRAQWITRNGKLVDTRTFRSLSLQDRHVEIAVVSCMDDGFPQQKAQWTALRDEKPEMLFLIGDNIYADHEGGKATGAKLTPELLWKRHTQTRSSLELFFAPELIPTFSIWDDHDYAGNDGTGDFAHKEASKEIFTAFFGAPQYPGVLERGPGLSFRLEAFGQAFFFLDGRYFRSGPEKTVGPQAEHFGRDTEAWLFSSLDGRTPSWLITGDQFFGAYHHFESYEGSHPTSFKKFLARLRQRGTPVAFVSGDRHVSEIMRIPSEYVGFETYEFTSSAIHARVFPGTFKEAPNPRQIEGVDGQMNFMILDIRTDAKWEVRAKAFGEKGKSLYKRTVYPADPETKVRAK